MLLESWNVLWLKFLLGISWGKGPKVISHFVSSILFLLQATFSYNILHNLKKSWLKTNYSFGLLLFPSFNISASALTTSNDKYWDLKCIFLDIELNHKGIYFQRFSISFHSCTELFCKERLLSLGRSFKEKVVWERKKCGILVSYKVKYE